jgi:hypothetical protein
MILAGLISPHMSNQYTLQEAYMLNRMLHSSQASEEDVASPHNHHKVSLVVGVPHGT